MKFDRRDLLATKHSRSLDLEPLTMTMMMMISSIIDGGDATHDDAEIINAAGKVKGEKTKGYYERDVGEICILS